MLFRSFARQLDYYRAVDKEEYAMYVSFTFHVLTTAYPCCMISMLLEYLSKCEALPSSYYFAEGLAKVFDIEFVAELAQCYV